MHDHDNPVLNFPPAPQWGNFLGQFGKFGVWAILAACVVTLILSILPGERFKVVRRSSFYLACAGYVLVFVVLAALFVGDQFQFGYVFSHSAKENPISYKIASVWTAQQGSFLLWALFSALFGWLTVAKSQSYERWYTAVMALFLGVLAGILAYETPFSIPDALREGGKIMLPPDGTGMVPGLQNYWVIIHPPIIFLGFGSLIVPFAYGIAAMMNSDAKDWVRLCRAPALFGLSVLGLGISLGGLWAYETQGWGGFWGWDPVENVSLVPWLFLVALSHGLIVQNARGKWASANLLLSGLPFISFVYGTFLTRSGLLDKVSVHSFASMEGNARTILKYFLIVLAAGFTFLMATKGMKAAKKIEPQEQDASGVNRVSFYQLGMMSLCLMSFVIALGMSWPAITAMRGGQGAAVEGDVYHRAVFWFFGAVMVAMAIGPFVSWKREQLSSVLSRFVTMASISIGIVGVFLILAKNPNWGVGMEPGAMVNGPWKGSHLPQVAVISVLLFFCVFVAITNLWRAIELGKRSKLGVGPFISHLGIAILLGGLIISKGLERTEKVIIRDGTPGTALGYKITFKDFDPSRYYDRSNVVKFDVTNPDGKHHEIDPNLYYYRSGDKEEAQTWPFIERTLSHDMYFFMQKPSVEYWEVPMVIKPGESKTQGAVTVTYNRMTRSGEPGQMGVEFGADLTVSYDNNTYKATPTLKMVGPGQLEPSLPKLSDDFRVAMTSMNANDRSVTLQLFLAPPLYPFQVFYKPLTCLVWIGTGIFTLGGFLSAFYRRVVRKSPEGDFKAKTATIDTNGENASITTA